MPALPSYRKTTTSQIVAVAGNFPQASEQISDLCQHLAMLPFLCDSEAWCSGSVGGTVVSTAASQRQGPGFDSRFGSLSLWSLHILPVSVRGFPPGAPVSSPSPKDVLVRVNWPC